MVARMSKKRRCPMAGRPERAQRAHAQQGGRENSCRPGSSSSPASLRHRVPADHPARGRFGQPAGTATASREASARCARCRGSPASVRWSSARRRRHRRERGHHDRPLGARLDPEHLTPEHEDTPKAITGPITPARPASPNRTLKRSMIRVRPPSSGSRTKAQLAANSFGVVERNAARRREAGRHRVGALAQLRLHRRLWLSSSSVSNDSTSA